MVSISKTAVIGLWNQDISSPYEKFGQAIISISNQIPNNAIAMALTLCDHQWEKPALAEPRYETLLRGDLNDIAKKLPKMHKQRSVLMPQK